MPNKKLMIEEATLDMDLEQFLKFFSDIKFTQPNKSNYDPSFWETTIQFQKYASASENIEGIQFNLSITFFKDKLKFLQYFGSPYKGKEGYLAACRAFNILRNLMIKNLGQPQQSTKCKEYENFLRETRPTDGHPDDRYVNAAKASWDNAWICLSEDSYASLNLEMRMEQ
jgi:hypothetical protein